MIPSAAVRIMSPLLPNSDLRVSAIDLSRFRSFASEIRRDTPASSEFGTNTSHLPGIDIRGVTRGALFFRAFRTTCTINSWPGFKSCGFSHSFTYMKALLAPVSVL